MTQGDSRLFPALLRHWRERRGMSQLELALAAAVSVRHVSFLENGRAQPSSDMVFGLAAALDVPLRDQNMLLEAAGFERAFPEPRLEDGLPPPIAQALSRMLQQQEPYPLIVMNQRYDVLMMNRAAALLAARTVVDVSAIGSPPNLLRNVFDPRLARSFLCDWERVAGLMLLRARRESLTRPSDTALAALVRALVEYPDIPQAVRQPDLAAPVAPMMSVRFRCESAELSFLATTTVFNAPQSVTLDELRIESYFPLDEVTSTACARMSAAAAAGPPG
jgi:transcriptional regulator with XRE-family HTH domain